ncbi:MAG: alpha/beta fold hydrolase [Burkholderiaceae bacterium]
MLSHPEPRHHTVQCASPSGLHHMAYVEWGDAANPDVLVCVHGLSRVGRDFDRLAKALANHYRVVCPDVVGRGASGRLANPLLYGVPQYVSDMVTLIARLNVPQVDWFGTSMGGLIGMSLAGLPDSPIARGRKLLINDVGPTLDPAALTRIGQYIGVPRTFASVEEATAAVKITSASFGLRTDVQWRELAELVIRKNDDGTYRLHYDMRIGDAFRTTTLEQAQAGEQVLWNLWANIKADTLVVRGAQSDLLSPATLQRMLDTNPLASSAEIAGVGHAPMFWGEDQIQIAKQFFLAST